MAQYLSPLVTILRGSVSGCTFTATRTASLAIRRRVKGCQLNNNNQIFARSALASAAWLWRSITSAQRSNWAVYGASVSKTKPTGSYFLTGREAMIGATQFAIMMAERGLISGDPDGSAPTLSGWLPIPTITIVPLIASGTGFRIQYSLPSSVTIDLCYARTAGGSPTRESKAIPLDHSTWTKQTIVGPASGYIVITGLTAGQAYWYVFRALATSNPYRISPQQTLKGIAAVYP